jgi:hypothetical protein
MVNRAVFGMGASIQRYTAGMVAKATPKENAALYENDVAAWSEWTAALIRAGLWDEIDRESVAEEIEFLARSHTRQIQSRMRVSIEHLLKWRHQAERRGASWRQTIRRQRREIRDLIDESPSIETHPRKVFLKAFQDGRDDALEAMEADDRLVPKIPPFTLEQALDPKFFPD